MKFSVEIGVLSVCLRVVFSLFVHITKHLCAMSSTTKRCSREDCKPQNIHIDLTTSCAECKNVVHLPCIGILVKVSQIDSPNVRILCNVCVAKPSNNTEEQSSETTPEQNEMNAILKEMRELRSLVTKNASKLDAIDGKTSALVEKTTTQQNLAQQNMPSAPSTSYPLNSPQFMQFTPRTNRKSNPMQNQQAKQSHAGIAKATDTPNAGKRKRSDVIVPSVVKKMHRQQRLVQNRTHAVSKYTQNQPVKKNQRLLKPFGWVDSSRVLLKRI